MKANYHGIAMLNATTKAVLTKAPVWFVLSAGRKSIFENSWSICSHWSLGLNKVSGYKHAQWLLDPFPTASMCVKSKITSAESKNNHSLTPTK